MRKELLKLIVIMAAVISFCIPVHAENATAYTYTYAPNGWVRTQDSYLVSEILFQDYDLRSPEDMFLKDGTLFIADTGNRRIVTMDIDSRQTGVIISEGLNSPTGVFVNDSGDIYVADNGAQAVFCFDQNGELKKTYSRPESAIFGKTTSYKPQKVYVDKDGILYIVGEGAFDGIIQLNPDGDFMGYFGFNDIHISPLEAMLSLIFTDEQQAKMFRRIPATFNNIAADGTGLIYTTTRGVDGTAVKKHNISGINIISQNMYDESDFVDVVVGRYGQIYAVSSNGLIYEYQNDGSLLFSFGGRAVASERNGMFSVVSAIEVSDNDTLYILDKEKSIIHVFVPTFFTENIHEAISLYSQGRYEQSKELWAEIIRQSGTTSMAHNGMALAEFQLQQYADANHHFRIAYNVSGYSDTYWQMRNSWFTDNMAGILIVLFVLFSGIKLLFYFDKKKGTLEPVRTLFAIPGKRFKLLRDIAFLKSFIKHPVDSFYYLRRDEKGSVAAATIIYILAFAVFVCSNLLMGFAVGNSGGGISEVSPIYVTMLFFAPILLWVFCNYLVSSITDGRGRVRDVYNSTAYSLMPLVIFYPIFIVASHFLTLNEIFIINFGTNIIWVWCAILLVIGLREIHAFESKDVIINIIISVFFMAIVVIVFSMVFMFWDRLVDFVYSLIKEAGYRGRQ